MNKQRIEIMEKYMPLWQIFESFQEERDAVFLDSSLANHLGRYSIVGLYPYLSLVKGKEFLINGEKAEGTFEEYVKAYLKEEARENTTTLPLTGGAIGYFSYDYGRKKEGVAATEDGYVEIPDCIWHFYDVFIIEDLVKREVTLVANGKKMDAKSRLSQIKQKIAQSVPSAKNKEKEDTFHQVSNFTKKDYLKAVDDMIGYIVEGDIYIANMTRQIQISSKRSPYEVFQKVRVNNPSPFGAYLNYGDFQIVSTSPERFLQLEEGVVTTRPIKGTRKRGQTTQEDNAMRRELESSEKDKSELLMIVDLERNDLNRVCEAGSVEVTELFTVEEYATVFHLSSTIQGKLMEGKTAMDLIEATFPGGSITGAPKLRAMEIIDELEHGRRNIYTGSIGYISLNGNCDFNIVIRTLLHKEGIYHLGVGGGITCESDTEFEFEETQQKAKALLEAFK